MLSFVVDENLPRSTATLLRELGFEVLDIRDHGLRGHEDQDIFRFAQDNQAILITIDRGFGNIFSFPPATHAGIVVVHLQRELPATEFNRQIALALKRLSSEDFNGNLVLIEPERIRIRRR